MTGFDFGKKPKLCRHNVDVQHASCIVIHPCVLWAWGLTDWHQISGKTAGSVIVVLLTLETVLQRELDLVQPV